MKSQLIFPTFVVVSLLLVSSSVLAVPTSTWSFQQSSIRPGTSGTLTIIVTNQENSNGERNFKICIQPTSSDQSYVTGSCDTTTIQTLTFGQSGTVTLTYSVSNDAPTPSSPPVSITLNYQYSVPGGWWDGSGSSSTNLQVAGISIRDEANQKLSQIGTSISSAQNAITSAQTSITTAQNMITTAQQQNKDISSANSYLSSAQSSLSSAQSSFSNAQNEYSQAQNLYTATSYQDSLNTINQASTDANNAASSASSANQAALQAQTAVTNAGCISGYTLQGGQCVQNSNPNNPVNPNNPNNPLTILFGSSGTWVIIVIIVLILAALYYRSQKKKKHTKHESKSE